MTKEEAKRYIQENGNQELVLATLKAMHAEGAPMTIEELDKRVRMKLAPAPAQQAVPATPQPVISQPANSDLMPNPFKQEQPDLFRQQEEPIQEKKPKTVAPSNALTILSVIIAIILILLLIAIIFLQVAPGSGVSLFIDSLIEKMRYSAVTTSLTLL